MDRIDECLLMYTSIHIAEVVEIVHDTEQL